MHLVIPFASALSEPARHALSTLQLPHLEALLARWDAAPAASRPEDDEYRLSTPHERVIAQWHGWPLEDGRLPLASALARRAGIDVGAVPAGHGWALLTPAHWQVGSDGVTLLDPALLSLGEAESRALHEAVRPLFEDLGWTFVYAAPLQWFAAHPMLDGLATASLDRAIGRGVDLWLGDDTALRAVRRLQSEVQMTLYTHPVNDAREARRELAVNSFWLSGTGPASATAATGELPADLVVDERLRAPALAGDWAAWAEAWRALDAGPLRALREAADGVAAAASSSLTLCGERHARRFAPAPRPWWKRLLSPSSRPAAPVLEAL